MTANDDYDSPWKEILEQYFQEFVEFFFPQIAADIDWHRGHALLDKELQQVVRDAELGRRYADVLVRVYRLGGDETWILVHVEVQGQRDLDFARRMFTYNYRIFDRYARPVVSLAVLADPHPHWRPNTYGWDLWGCTMGLTFPVVKLLDYQDRWQELAATANPFAACTMAHLKTMESKDDPAERKQWKFAITKMLYGKGRDRQYVVDLFRFIDWLMRLPEDLEEEFLTELHRLEEEHAMPYITSVERIGFRKGMQRGIQQMQAMLVESLETLFGPVDPAIRDRIAAINDDERLRALHRRLLTAADLAEFTAALGDA